MSKLKQHWQLLTIIVAVVIIFCLPSFIHSPYYLDLIITGISNALLAMTFIICLKVGLINLSTAVFWGMGAYTTAVLMVKYDFSFWASLPLSAVITGVIAWGLSYILIGQKTSAFSFVMFTAILGSLFSLAVGNISFLGGYNGFPNIPDPNPINLFSLATIEFNSKVPYFYLILVIAVVVILVLKSCYSSWAGRAFTSVGLDAKLAESIGISSFRFRMFAFILSSAIAGLIGSFYATYHGFIIATGFGMWKTIYVQIYAILGGVGYAVLGPIIGSGVMTVLTETLRPWDLYSPLIVGALLMLLIAFLPDGLLGLLKYKNTIKTLPQNKANLSKILTSTFNFKRK
ncbi:MAG: branched-chain amino acid ABC transporter permease [Dehalococcoidales bacterium]|nr:branched-chain amino acid ABC transporter permease [Dehalococcoidales bacterium]